MILKFIETLQFRLIFKILLLNGRAHFVLDDSAAPILYRFSPTSRASLEEKRVSVQKLLTIFCDFFTSAEDRWPWWYFTYILS